MIRKYTGQRIARNSESYHQPDYIFSIRLIYISLMPLIGTRLYCFFYLEKFGVYILDH